MAHICRVYEKLQDANKVDATPHGTYEVDEKVHGNYEVDANHMAHIHKVYEK